MFFYISKVEYVNHGTSDSLICPIEHPNQTSSPPTLLYIVQVGLASVGNEAVKRANHCLCEQDKLGAFLFLCL